MLTPEDEAEVAELARQFGDPRRWQREYAIDSNAHSGMSKMLKRRGEVVLAIPRPGGRVLVHTKPFYPEGIYRLLSGGVHRGEKILDAARREVYEETGFEVEPVRFIGIVENIFTLDGQRYLYPTFIFETEPTAEPPRVVDPDEQITGFREVPRSELPKVAQALEGLDQDWREWGRFRAAPHVLVAQASG